MRIGILGGSFNPVHNGHLRLGVEALEQLPLDRVDLVPAAVPPHKPEQRLLPFSFRYQLLQLAVQNFPDMWVNPVEGEREGPSYTVYTLKAYNDSYPKDDLFFILGADEFFFLPKWYQWQELPYLTNFIVFARQGQGGLELEEVLLRYWPDIKAESEKKFSWRFPHGHMIKYIEIPRLDISSTLIRDKWDLGLSLTYLVPEKVEQSLWEFKRNISKQ